MIPQGVQDIVGGIVAEIVNPLIGIIFAAALVYFVYGLMVFIFNAGDQAKREDGKRHLMWGVIGMFVMVSVYGLLNIGLDTFGLQGGDYPAGDYPAELNVPLGR